jgi:hypothetical protein
LKILPPRKRNTVQCLLEGKCEEGKGRRREILNKKEQRGTNKGKYKRVITIFEKLYEAESKGPPVQINVSLL